MFNLLGLTAAIPPVILGFGIVVIVMSVFLIIAVLMQQGKQHNLSGTIAGAADTFFGKTKGSTISKKLSVITSIVAIIFVILVLAFYIVQTPNDTTAPADTTPVESTVDSAADAVDSAVDSAADAVDSAADAISDAADSAADAISDAADSAADAISEAVESN